MFRIKCFLKNNKIFAIFISVLSLFRIYLGMNMPIYILLPGRFDDMLFIRYSNLKEHFYNWDYLSLSKDMSYSLFLYFVKISHISYKFWLSLLWIIAAILVIYTIYKYLTKNKFILTFFFMFILFLPVGFDNFCGQRVYRNAIITPVTIIVLSILYIFVNKLLDSSVDIKNKLIWGILLGLTFTLNYYIKEDGILTMPILIICILAVLLLKIYDEINFNFTKQNFKKIIKITLICIIPLLIFTGGTIAYQEVNNYYFGVAEINTRTSGQLGEFFANLLKIEDSNKNITIWVPVSTVEKAVNASPTLQSRSDFVNTFLDNNAGESNIRNSSIIGDLVAWDLRIALHEAGMYENEKSVNNFFFKVNNELNSAFDNGTLNKSDKIFINSYAAGKDINEIHDLEPYVLSGLEMTLFYKGFEFNNIDVNRTTFYKSTTLSNNSSQDLHDRFTLKSDLDNLSTLDSIPLLLMQYDSMIYQIISYVLVLMAFVSFLGICFYTVKDKMKNRNMIILILFNIILFGTVLVQIFGVSWFCSFLPPHEGIGSLDNLLGHIKFYLVSAYGFFSMFVVLTISGLYSIYNKSREKIN